MSPLEEAEGYDLMLCYGWSTDGIAQELRKTRTYVEDRLTLLKAKTAVRIALQAKAITADEAVTIIRHAQEESRPQHTVVQDVIAAKAAQRHKYRQNHPLRVEGISALTPLVNTYGFDLLKTLLDEWPYETEDNAL